MKKIEATTTNNPAQVWIYRDQSGGARVHPGALVVLLGPMQAQDTATIVVTNCTEEDAVVTVPDYGHITLAPASNDGSRKQLELKDIKRGVYFYEVTVGHNIAEGNSAPTIIIDQ